MKDEALLPGNYRFIDFQVDSDADRFSTTIPGENTALNIETDMHFVAGVPTSMKTDRFDTDIEWKGFFGCVLSVKPSQVGVSEVTHLSLVRERCSRPPIWTSIIRFVGNGGNQGATFRRPSWCQPIASLASHGQDSSCSRESLWTTTRREFGEFRKFVTPLLIWPLAAA